MHAKDVVLSTNFYFRSGCKRHFYNDGTGSGYQQTLLNVCKTFDAGEPLTCLTCLAQL